MADKAELTEKERLFIAGLVAGKTKTQAYIDAGHEEGPGARNNAVRMSKKRNVSAEIKARLEKVTVKAELKAEQALEAIRKPLVADVRKLFDQRGNLRPITELDDDEAALVAGFEVIKKNAAAGDGHTDTVHKVRLVDRSRYVEMAAKHFGLLTDRIAVTGDATLFAHLDAWKAQNKGQ